MDPEHLARAAGDPHPATARRRPAEPRSLFRMPSDLAAVRSKFAPFVDAGARVVMVSFDDVAKTLTHAEDIAAYGQGDEAFGRANGNFLTRLAASYRGRGVRLLTVGADYSGTADTAYLKGLRATLDRSVEVMWTGTNIPSEDWRAADARAYGERIGRRPLVWDNWTNTDTTGSIFGSCACGMDRSHLPRAIPQASRGRRRGRRVLLQRRERGRPEQAAAGHRGRLPRPSPAL